MGVICQEGTVLNSGPWLGDVVLCEEVGVVGMS